MPDPGDCNCPSTVDILRGRADGTKPDCPVHDTPAMREMLKDLVPLRRFPGAVAWFPPVTPVAEPLSQANAPGFGTGC